MKLETGARSAHGRRAHVALHIAMLTALLGIGACAELNYMRYERPALFHPTTARIAQEIREAPTPARSVGTPAPANEATGPSDRAAGDDTAAPTAAAGSAETAAQPDDAQFAPDLALTVTPPRTLRANSGTYEFTIHDDCSGGGAPVATINPQVTARVEAVDESKLWHRLLIDSATLPATGELEVTVRSCRAQGMSPEAAGTAGLLDSQRVAINATRLTTTFNVWSADDTREEFGTDFAASFTAADVVFENPNGQPVLLYGSSLTAGVRFLVARERVQELFSKKALEDPALLRSVNYEPGRSLDQALDFTDKFRPLSFSDVLAIFTYKKESDPRQRTIAALKSVGELAVAAGTFSGVGADYAKSVGLFTGVFTPEVEKLLLWDVLLHVKNLQERSLKEVEEIPGRGQLRRVVFFPRRPIEGIVPFAPVYIAEILPATVQATAVIIDKQAVIQGSP